MPRPKRRAQATSQRPPPAGRADGGRVCDLMARPLFTVGHRATLGTAWALMRAREIGHLPVLDDERRLIGLVSDHDLQQAVLDRVLGEPPGAAKPALDRLWVDEVMTWGISLHLHPGCGRSEPKLAGKRRPCRPAPKALSMEMSRDSSSRGVRLHVLASCLGWPASSGH